VLRPYLYTEYFSIIDYEGLLVLLDALFDYSYWVMSSTFGLLKVANYYYYYYYYGKYCYC